MLDVTFRAGHHPRASECLAFIASLGRKYYPESSIWVDAAKTARKDMDVLAEGKLYDICEEYRTGGQSLSDYVLRLVDWIVRRDVDDETWRSRSLYASKLLRQMFPAPFGGVA